MNKLVMVLLAAGGIFLSPAVVHAQEANNPVANEPLRITHDPLYCRIWTRDRRTVDVVGMAPIFPQGLPEEVDRVACIRRPATQAQPSAGGLQPDDDDDIGIDDEIESEFGIRPEPIRDDILLM